MNIIKRKNDKGDKIYFTLDCGRGSGQRYATGIFIYARPQNQVEKNHNKDALLLVETQKSELLLEQQALGSGFIPTHKFKANFLDYYQEFVNNNQRKGNRHLSNSQTQFKLFLGKEFISPIDVTENLCKRFRQFLLDKFSGETPANYFHHFKQVTRAATKDNYWRHNPTEAVNSKKNTSKTLKEHLEADEYIKLLETPCFNEVIKDAFTFSCYTGLRYVDVEDLQWHHIKDNQLTTRIIQHKTGKPVILTLHPISLSILTRRKKLLGTNRTARVFELPSHDGCNKILKQWISNAGIKKHITWSCARLSFSILLQDKNVDIATVAYLMGHTTSDQVNRIYRRHRPISQVDSVARLPSPEVTPLFLNS